MSTPCQCLTEYKRKMKRVGFILVIMGLVGAYSCKKEKITPNPFDDLALQPPINTDTLPDPDPTSFVGLHNNIFKPICANSGCHDGTFEPDYRSIESAYNTLVYRPIIKNDPQATYTYRVLPNNAELSVLYQRLIIDIDGQSGIMPLSVDQGSDWNSKKSQYINDIKTWINNGAKDMFGNDPVKGNKEPQMAGVVAFAGGPAPLARASGNGPIQVPNGTNSITIWFSLSDDVTSPQNLTYNKVKFSKSVYDFSNSPEMALQVGSSITEDGYFGDPVTYYHSLTKNLSEYSSGTTVFVRIYVQDEHNDVTEIPSDGSLDYILDYFAFEIE